MMAAPPLCWIAVAFATMGMSVLGVLLRVVWQRLNKCEDARIEMARTLNEVETKLLMLETWKAQIENGG